jgi:hypothetical protein
MGRAGNKRNKVYAIMFYWGRGTDNRSVNVNLNKKVEWLKCYDTCLARVRS